MKRTLSLLSVVSLFAVACSQSPIEPTRGIAAGARSGDAQCSASGSTQNNSNNPPATTNNCNNNNNNNNNTNNDNNPPATAKP
jgi:hypothetical protein